MIRRRPVHTFVKMRFTYLYKFVRMLPRPAIVARTQAAMWES